MWQNSSTNNNRGGSRNSNYHGRGGRNNRSSGRGGRGRGTGGGGRNSNPQQQFGTLRLCKDFSSLNGNCSRGNSCNFLHLIRLHATVKVSEKLPVGEEDQASRNNYNNAPPCSPVSDISIWEQPGGSFKIFTSSHDGFWRLWNPTNGAFNMEFEHNLYGKVFKCQVNGNFLIAGLEAPSANVPVPVGQTHVWDLQNPQQPPTELHMIRNAANEVTKSIPYAHNLAVTSIHMNGQIIVTGSRDGSIRLWKLNQLQSYLCGHAREVTALVLTNNNTHLWSSGIDHYIRIWNCTDSSLQLAIPTPSPVTSLVPYQDLQFILTSTMDGAINVWKADSGECLSGSTGSEGIICMCVAKDVTGNDILLTGMQNGAIQGRNILPLGSKTPALTLLFTLSRGVMGTQHTGAVYSLTAGPSGTFYSGGADGQMFVMSFADNVMTSLQ